MEIGDFVWLIQYRNAFLFFDAIYDSDFLYNLIYQALCFNRESLTAIVYFFKVREIFSMPIMDEKYNYIQYIKLDKLTDVNGNQYRLYNGTKQYRYRHAYNLLIDSQIDPTDRSQFTAALKQAWLDYNGVW